MAKNKETIIMIVAILGIIIFGTAIAPIQLQNDTFYTIKIGQYILENGISQYDPFSFHETLPYTFPHWMYDVSMGIIHNIGGMFGVYLSTVGLTVGLAVVWFIVNCKLHKNKLTSFILALALLYLMEIYIAARAQLLTFSIFILEIFFIERFLTNKKIGYAIGLIVLPAILANVHLAVFPFYFILFLPYIGEYAVAVLAETPNYIRQLKIHDIDKKLRKGKLEEEKKKELEKKAENLQEKIVLSQEKTQRRRANAYKLKVEKNDNVRWLILVMVIAMFTGLLTPLGDTPYTYLVKTLQGNTTQYISEHLPIMLIAAKPQLCLIVIMLAILIFTDTKIRLKDLFLAGGLLLLALMSRRQMSMFVIMGLTILNGLIVALVNKYDKDGCTKFINLMQKPLGIVLTLALVLVMCIPSVKNKIDDKFIPAEVYPIEACDYILENLDVENIRIYNEYNYGSYMIYRGIPVFIDSRADLYTPEFDYEQQRDIFSDFINLSWNYVEVFERYDITHILIPVGSGLKNMIAHDKDYTQIYEDEYFCIWEKIASEVE